MGKMNKNYANFFTNAIAAGYGTNEIVSFIQNLYQSPSSTAERDRLKEGQSKGTLRPDEVAAAQSHHDSEFGERALKGASNAASVIGGAGFAATKLPGLIQKGVGVLGAMGAGGQSQQQPQQQEQQQAPVQKQPQQQGFDPLAGLKEFPELIQFIQKERKSGGNAQSIGSKARKSAKLSIFVNAIEQNTGEEFESILARLLEQPQQAQQQVKQGQSSSKMNEFVSALSRLENIRSGKARG